MRSFQYREKEQQKTGPAQQRPRPVPQRSDTSAYLKLKFFLSLKRAQPKKVPGSRKGKKPILELAMRALPYRRLTAAGVR
ncbi:hypothetical protein [Janthinobacterium sp. PSPC1-1]|uniref:hypothetical protein n=1 Tax=Janthinobacterium sp. PSPC1-1 TaxID=2804581 RepID=UPI003CF9856E